MKIYKFKDLTDERKHSHFLQIVLDEKIWCASPDSLNDEEEFKFQIVYEPLSSITVELLSEVVARHRTSNYRDPNLSAEIVLQQKRLEERAKPIIKGLIDECRETIGITSFSTNTDGRLWAEYGGQGNGVCIEIDIPDALVGTSFHRVEYVSEKKFHIDFFLERLLCKEKAFKILTTKTKKWSHEGEIRFIGERQNVSWFIDGYIVK